MPGFWLAQKLFVVELNSLRATNHHKNAYTPTATLYLPRTTNHHEIHVFLPTNREKNNSLRSICISLIKRSRGFCPTGFMRVYLPLSSCADITYMIQFSPSIPLVFFPSSSFLSLASYVQFSFSAPGPFD